MRNLYTIYFFAFDLMTGNVSADAFGLLYSKLLPAKLCLLYLVPFLLHCIGNLYAYIVDFVISYCLWLSVRGREGWA